MTRLKSSASQSAPRLQGGLHRRGTVDLPGGRLRNANSRCHEPADHILVHREHCRIGRAQCLFNFANYGNWFEIK